jgi:hypothetical protein
VNFNLEYISHFDIIKIYIAEKKRRNVSVSIVGEV